MNPVNAIAPNAIDLQSVTALLGPRAKLRGPATPLDSKPMQLAALDLKRGVKTQNVDQLLLEFQNILLEEMMKAMRQTVPKSELFGESTARDIYESFLDAEYVRTLGKQTQSLGLSEVLRRQLGLSPGENSPTAKTSMPIQANKWTSMDKTQNPGRKE